MAIELLINTNRIVAELHLNAQWTVVFGHSGSGKTSLLRFLAGLWMPEGAALFLGGATLTDTPAHERRIVLLAQHPKLFPNKSAYENVLFKTAGKGRAGFDDGHFWLQRLKVDHVEKQMPHQLSGGEQQRVAIARALITAPKVLLMDESFSGTDRALRAELIGTLKQWATESSAQIISVTHDVAEAFECADQVVKLADGRVIAQASPQEVLAEERAELLNALAD